MKRIENVCEIGPVIAPDGKNQLYHSADGGGVREAVCVREGDWWYMAYDGAMPGKTPESYWNACLARSRDLKNWEKLGPVLKCSALARPEGGEAVYKDFRSAASPWSFYADGTWYHYYMGADHCDPQGVPGFAYSTMLATSQRMAGPWDKLCDEPGKEKHVCLRLGERGAWDDETASPGFVLENPAYAADPAREKKYLMIYSGSCTGVTKRSLGITRTDDLSAAGAFDDPDGRFWQKDPEPLLPPSEDIENSSLYFDDREGVYWLFTNHVRDNRYTDAVWVYWSRDLTHWNVRDKAVAMDASMSRFGKGAIGMPSVVKMDDNALALFYDASPDGRTDHLDRFICLATIPLPLRVRDD